MPLQDARGEEREDFGGKRGDAWPAAQRRAARRSPGEGFGEPGMEECSRSRTPCAFFSTGFPGGARGNHLCGVMIAVAFSSSKNDARPLCALSWHMSPTAWCSNHLMDHCITTRFGGGGLGKP